MSETLSTNQVLEKLGVPFWRLEHLVRSGRVRPLKRGRGHDRKYSLEEYHKARRILVEDAEPQRV